MEKYKKAVGREESFTMPALNVNTRVLCKDAAGRRLDGFADEFA